MPHALRPLIFLSTGLLLTTLVGCATPHDPPPLATQKQTLCTSLVPSVASILLSDAREENLDVHETGVMRQWYTSCQGSPWDQQLAGQMSGTHPPISALTGDVTTSGGTATTLSLGERVLDVMRATTTGSSIQSTTCRTMRTTGRKGSAYVTNCTTY